MKKSKSAFHVLCAVAAMGAAVCFAACGDPAEPPQTHDQHAFSDEWTIGETHHWHACSGCDEKKDEAAHAYLSESAQPQYLKTEATCTQKAVYYTSCVCGAAGTATFTAGGFAEHSYLNGVCANCGTDKPSEGLTYRLNADNNSYTVTGIGSCTDQKIVIPATNEGKSVTSIGENAFADSNVENVTIPNSVTSIGEGAFGGCTSLETVTLGSGVEEIGDNAFFECAVLKSIQVNPDNAYFTSQNGILYNKAKTEFILIPENLQGAIVLPDGIAAIGDFAFYNREITSIAIGSGVTSISKSAFDGCVLNAAYTVSESNACFSSQDGILYDKGKTEIKFVPLAIEGTISLPDSLLAIGNSAFSGCTSLTGVTIGNKVASIGYYAFDGCSALASVTLGSGVTSIDTYAFRNCDLLTRITIPVGVTEISQNAFAGVQLTIYCEAAEKPSGWENGWNGQCSVVWDSKNNETNGN